jgi:beta-glucosidase-like glycosyl hydrolase
MPELAVTTSIWVRALIYRTPLGGRNFEYNTGEDPFLGSELVVPLVIGFQKQGVWANLKHYAANEQEYRRENINILVGERALREIICRLSRQQLNRGTPLL